MYRSYLSFAPSSLIQVPYLCHSATGAQLRYRAIALEARVINGNKYNKEKKNERKK
jgi:hypothetical protein